MNMMSHEILRSSVLQSVAVCCSVCVMTGMWMNMMSDEILRSSVLQSVAVCVL